MKNLPIKKPGFTLIELLISISIIAILIAAGSYSWVAAQVKARDSRRKADLKTIQQSLEAYMLANKVYPTANSGSLQCNSGTDTTLISWGGTFTCSSITFLQKLPQDPTKQTNGYYYSSATPRTYILSANLENTNDGDLSSLPCTPQLGTNYCVINP